MAFLDEASDFRTLLEQRYGETPTPVSVRGPDEVARFWKAIGWAPFMKSLGLVSPVAKENRTALTSTLRLWREDGTSTLRRSDLPKQVRMVTRDAGDGRFWALDESDGEAMLVAVDGEQNRVEPADKSYTAVVSSILYGLAPTATWLRAQPVSLFKGVSRFPTLVPDVVETPLGLQIESRDGTSVFAANRPADLVQWLKRAPIKKVELESIGPVQYLADGFETILPRLEDPHELPAWQKNARLVLGTIGGTDVLLGRDASGSSWMSADTPRHSIYSLSQDVAPFHWPVEREPLPGVAVAIAADTLRAALLELDDEHGSIAPSSDEPAALREYLAAIGRGPLTDALWPTAGSLPDGPKRSRKIAFGPSWEAFTDEDDGRDDPVAVWRSNGSIVLAAARSTNLFGRFLLLNVAKKLAVEVNVVLKNTPWSADDASLTRLAPGVFRWERRVFAKDADAWLAYLDTLDDKVVRGAGPPSSFERARVAAPKPADERRLETLGLRKTKRTSQEYIIAGKKFFGRLEGIPVWIEAGTLPKGKKTVRVISVAFPPGERAFVAEALGALED